MKRRFSKMPFEPQLKAVKTRLESRCGLFLCMRQSNDDPSTIVVGGNKDKTDPSCMFYLIPVGLRVVSIQHAETGNFVAMNSNGKIYASEIFGLECKFKENVFENYWCIYSSLQYKHPETQRPWHLGLNENGKCIRGSKAKKDRNVSHFLPRPVEVMMMREPSHQEIVGQSRSSQASGINEVTGEQTV
ncbi:Oidioi.mRNA.OKI2018_I69.chr2.g6780.t1.cds [Oikopleura dioica]|uniref:Fibroblast growth factor n=1 Tax=Oikopleura dioica TaxID=34765 RepID=A0ABN7T531_OIKDI|nr:Oidioi.mRNA.OKI2018_I69.chr2.g6780.t1.cds [Oikopleura dioica]